MSYDSWLEAPYQQAAAESDAYVTWCEANDRDPDEDHYDDFRADMDDRREDAEIAAAEARAEARADMMMERGEW